jgi:hypothetical protein
MENTQMFGSDLSIIGSKHQAIDYMDEGEDFQTSIAVIQFNESLVNLDIVNDETIEESFKMNKEKLNNSLQDLFEEGVKITLSLDTLNNLK